MSPTSRYAALLPHRAYTASLNPKQEHTPCWSCLGSPAAWQLQRRKLAQRRIPSSCFINHPQVQDLDQLYNTIHRTSDSDPPAYSSLSHLCRQGHLPLRSDFDTGLNSWNSTNLAEKNSCTFSGLVSHVGGCGLLFPTVNTNWSCTHLLQPHQSQDHLPGPGICKCVLYLCYMSASAHERVNVGINRRGQPYHFKNMMVCQRYWVLYRSLEARTSRMISRIWIRCSGLVSNRFLYKVQVPCALDGYINHKKKVLYGFS